MQTATENQTSPALASSAQPARIMSVQEVKARYIRFCLNHELDHTAPPQSQIDLVVDDKSRSCLIRLIKDLNNAKQHGVIFARGKIAQLRALYASLSENGLSDFKDAYVFKSSE